jgi:uncharacterized membrane protein YoaK (UPF0700 family)
MAAGTVGEDRLLMSSLMLLTAVTGLVDAASVLGLGRIFTGNMTGNVLLLGFAIGGAHDVSVTASFVALAGFLVGGTCGGRLARGAERRALGTALALEFALLLAAACVSALVDQHAGAARNVLLVLLAIPMGLQSAAARRLAVPDLSTVVLTSILTGIAVDSSLAGGTNARLAPRVGAVLSMFSGAVAGAFLLRRGMVWTIETAVVIHAMAVAGVLSARVSRSAAR